MALHSFGELLQRVEVVAVNLDRDLSVNAGDHVADEVRQRLLDFDVHAGHLVAQFRQAVAG